MAFRRKGWGWLRAGQVEICPDHRSREDVPSVVPDSSSVFIHSFAYSLTQLHSGFPNSEHLLCAGEPGYLLSPRDAMGGVGIPSFRGTQIVPNRGVCR